MFYLIMATFSSHDLFHGDKDGNLTLQYTARLSNRLPAGSCLKIQANDSNDLHATQGPRLTSLIQRVQCNKQI
jgi:hypothetical protein